MHNFDDEHLTNRDSNRVHLFRAPTGLNDRDQNEYVPLRPFLHIFHIAREDGELCKDLSCSNVWVRLSKYTGHLRPFKRALAVYIEVYMKLSLKIQCLYHWMGGRNFRIWWRNGPLRWGGGGMPTGKCLNWKAFLLQYKAYGALFVPPCATSSQGNPQIRLCISNGGLNSLPAVLILFVLKNILINTLRISF